MPDQLQAVLALRTRPPAVPPGLVRRSALYLRLTAAASTRPVTLVSAGPGSGKTSAVASWTAYGAARDPVGWLSLESSDNDVRSFWSNLIFALVQSGGVPDDSSLRDITPAAQFGAAEVLEIRARLAELPSPVVLVLDDFHEISDEGVLRTFGDLVDHLPPTLRLMLLTRSDPTLRLHRLRVAGQLGEIRTDDLAFTEPETVELFAGSGIHLNAEQVTALRDRTEGWPAGLRLAAMSLSAKDVQSGIDRFSGSDRSVAEYLVGEVTQRLSPADSDFLLMTSVVDRVSGALADHLTGRTDGQTVLEGFARSNAFVIGLGGHYDWFRFHPLLRQLMRHRLGLERPRLLPELHRRAATWMAEQGEPIEAIRHWILAGDHQQAGRTLLQVIPKMLTSEGPALAAAIEPLAATAADNPSLTALFASTAWHYHRHEFAAMRRANAEARRFLGEADEKLSPTAELWVSVFDWVAARVDADTAAVVELANLVIDGVDRAPAGTLPAGRPLRATALVNLAGARVWAGEHEDDEQLLDSAEVEALELGLLLAYLNTIGHHALLDVLHGRCRAASRRTTEVLQTADRRGWGSEPQVLAALLSRGLVHLSRHDFESADGCVQRGLAASGGETDRALRLALGIAAVQIAVSRGDAAAALTADARVSAGLARTPAAPDLLLRWAAVAGGEALLLAGRPDDVLTRVGHPGDRVGFASSWERVCLARARFVLGEPAAAEALIEPLLRSTGPYREPAVTAWLLEAVMATVKHRDAAALSAVTAALDLAQPEGIQRPFLLIGSRLPDLLMRYRNLGGRHTPFVDALLQRLAPQRLPATEPPVVDNLTERERMVLRYLPTLLNATEIAADLYVSVNTVKSQLQSLYRKLGVNNRRDAVERARSAGLL